MKRILYIALSFFVAFIFLAPISLSANGAYNKISKTIWCSTKTACIHEVAHYLDDKNDYPSKTWQFSLALRMYINDELRSDAASQIALDIYKYQFQHHAGIQNLYMSYPMGELYAEIFEMTKGKEELMPEQLKKFYNWELAKTLLKEYE